MSKNQIIKLVVLALVIIGVAFLIYKKSKENPYSIVYLTTGEVYIGKLSTFPDLELKDSYILQTTKDATDPAKSNFQLQPISQALWAPQSLHLTEKNVIFYGPLLPTSKIAQTIVAQKK